MDESILEIVEREAGLLHNDRCDSKAALPSTQKIQRIMDLIWEIIFYTNFHPFNHECDTIRLGLLTIFTDLTVELEILNKSFGNGDLDARRVAKGFLAEMHNLKCQILGDVDAVLRKDPAASGPLEIIASYPSIRAILYYRVARVLFNLKVPVLPRMITELAHSATGIDIHPGAAIGRNFAIDHGTGVVIGETCVIGNNVTLYQGVTLGAKAFTYDDDGMPMAVPRHPILEDNVTVYSNSSILGRITVGHDTVIGGNVWLTHSVAPYSKITQSTAITQPKPTHNS